MRILLMLLLCFSFLSFGRSATVMLQLRGRNIKLKDESKMVIRMGVEEILTNNGYELVSEEDQNQILKEQADQQRKGCYDDACLVQVGRMSAAQGVFLVDIVKIGRQFAFKLKYLDMERGTLVKSASMIYRSQLRNGGKLLPFSKKVTEKMFKRKMVNKRSVAKGCSNGMCGIPPGDFMMGCNSSIDQKCQKNEKPYRKVSLDGYYIDQYEVTVSDFRACVTAGKCRTKNFKTKEDYKFYNYGNSNRNNHPMNGVNWEGANEYCKWKGKRLPTEAEWEKAARGVDGRIYPWGNKTASCTYAVIMNSTSFGCGKRSTWSVGSKPLGRSPYGLYDMGGNVWEWCSDQDKTGQKESRILRGGSWDFSSDHLRTSYRYKSPPNYGGHNFGFRCACQRQP